MSIAFVTRCLPSERGTLVAAAVSATRYLIFVNLPDLAERGNQVDSWPVDGAARAVLAHGGVDLAVRSYPLLNDGEYSPWQVGLVFVEPVRTGPRA